MKILINLCSMDLPESAFDELTKPFEGYEIFNFQFPITEYYLDMIDTILNYLSAEENIKPYETKIVLQSNISNLLIAWYRLYNDVIDEFVLVDQRLVTYIPIEHESEIMAELSRLTSIEDDPCHGRLYYRRDGILSEEILKVFIESYQYNLLQPFTEVSIYVEYTKKKFEKGYMLKGNTYTRATAKNSVDKLVVLQSSRDFNEDIRITDIEQPFGYFLVFTYIFNLSIEVFQKIQATSSVLQQMSEKDKRILAEYMTDYLESTESELPFKEVINLYSFLAVIGTDATIVEKMLNYIVKDETHMLDYYAPYTNTLFYLEQANQQEYYNYFLDRIEIMRKLKNYYKPKLNIHAQRLDNHLVIVTGQLLNNKHAPTKVTIDYANNLLKYYPNLKIKIVVEDMFNYSPDELFFVYAFTSADSKILSEEHRKLLHPSIEVHYSNHELSREKRLQDDINAITDCKPQWILKYGAPDSLAVDQLYDYYPVVNMSASGAEYSEFVHMSLGGRDKKEVIAERKSKGIINDNYNYELHIPGLEFPQSTGSYTRTQFGIKENDFVIVTVGNRLDAEIDVTFANGMKNLLDKYSTIKWLLVGTKENILINKSFEKTLKQVKYVGYTEKLMDIYEVCDVYANPFRQGGGISVAMAMDAGLPVVNSLGKNDASVYIPKEKLKSKENYFDYIEKLFLDKDIWIDEGLIFQIEFRKKFKFEQATLHILELLQKSDQCYVELANTK